MSLDYANDISEFGSVFTLISNLEDELCQPCVALSQKMEKLGAAFKETVSLLIYLLSIFYFFYLTKIFFPFCTFLIKGRSRGGELCYANSRIFTIYRKCSCK